MNVAVPQISLRANRFLPKIKERKKKRKEKNYSTKRNEGRKRLAAEV
jgi:hypothetical protein